MSIINDIVATIMLTKVLGRLLHNVRAGNNYSVWNRAQLQAPTSIHIGSSAFGEGTAIPLRHAGVGVGMNISPALHWSGIPGNAKQLLLIIEDTDVPLPRPLIHTIALIDARLDGLDENGLARATTEVTFVPASFGRIGYAGPRPISGHGVHHYGFYLYALDKAIDPSKPPKSLGKTLQLLCGHVIARGGLIGTCERTCIPAH